MDCRIFAINGAQVVGDRLFDEGRFEFSDIAYAIQRAIMVETLIVIDTDIELREILAQAFQTHHVERVARQSRF